MQHSVHPRNPTCHSGFLYFIGTRSHFVKFQFSNVKRDKELNNCKEKCHFIWLYLMCSKVSSSKRIREIRSIHWKRKMTTHNISGMCLLSKYMHMIPLSWWKGRDPWGTWSQKEKRRNANCVQKRGFRQSRPWLKVSLVDHPWRVRVTKIFWHLFSTPFWHLTFCGGTQTILKRARLPRQSLLLLKLVGTPLTNRLSISLVGGSDWLTLSPSSLLENNVDRMKGFIFSRPPLTRPFLFLPPFLSFNRGLSLFFSCQAAKLWKVV